MFPSQGDLVHDFCWAKTLIHVSSQRGALVIDGTNVEWNFELASSWKAYGPRCHCNFDVRSCCNSNDRWFSPLQGGLISWFLP